MNDSAFWFTPAQPPEHRMVELVHGPRDGAVIEIGPHVTEWAAEQDGRYAPRDGHNPNQFFWDSGMNA